MRKLSTFIILVFLAITNTSFTSYKDLTVKSIVFQIANVHVIQSNGKTILIDAATEGKNKRIEKRLKKMGIDIKDVDGIIVTHGHNDHAGTAKYFQETYNIPIIAGKGDLDMLEAGKQRPFKTTSQYARFINKFIKNTFPPVTPDILIDSTYNLNQLGIEGKIIPMPGHTKGSLVVLIDDMAFVGDMLRSATFIKKAPRTHFFHEDIELARKNIDTILENENIETFYVGHGGPLSRERVKDFFKEK